MAESPSAPGSAIKASTKHCSFLKLDEDIRRMVYDILEALPRKDMDKKDRARVRDFSQEAHEEFRKLTVTRKNLRLTCKQIKNEWTPAFLRSTTFCLSLIRMRLGFEIFVLNKLSKTEIMNIRRIVFDGSRQGLFAKYGCPDLRSSDAEVLRTLASVLTRHKDQLRLETLDITLFDDFGPRLLRREKEVTVAQLARYHYRKNGWKPYYIGMFETQITGRSWKEPPESSSGSEFCEAEWDVTSISSDTIRRAEGEKNCYWDSEAGFDANDGLEDTSETDGDLVSDVSGEEIAEDEIDDEEDSFNANQDLSHQDPEAVEQIEIAHMKKRKRAFSEVEE